MYPAKKEENENRKEKRSKNRHQGELGPFRLKQIDQEANCAGPSFEQTAIYIYTKHKFHINLKLFEFMYNVKNFRIKQTCMDSRVCELHV